VNANCAAGTLIYESARILSAQYKLDKAGPTISNHRSAELHIFPKTVQTISYARTVSGTSGSILSWEVLGMLTVMSFCKELNVECVGKVENQISR
jgi:hypothetical protein